MLINVISKFPNDEGIYEYYEDVEDFLMPESHWEHNPDITGVVGADQKLWKYNGSNIVALTVDGALRIDPHLPKFQDDDTTSIDFSLLGLNATPWEFSRGARTVRKYTDDNGDLVVSDNYTYTMDDGRTVSAITRNIEWFNGDGSVGKTKNVTSAISRKKLKELNRLFRQGRMDYLEASAEEFRDVADLSPEPYKTQYNQIADSIDVLFDHYADVVLKYISRGTMEFEDAVENETDPTILAIHAIPTAPPSTQFPSGLTVRTSILYQLRGYLVTPGDSPI